RSRARRGPRLRRQRPRSPKRRAPRPVHIAFVEDATWPLPAQDSGARNRLDHWPDTGQSAPGKAPAAVARKVGSADRRNPFGGGGAFRFGNGLAVPAPRFRGLKQRAHQKRVQRMAGLVGHKAATNRRASKGQVPNRIEQFVTYEFVLEAK